MSILQLYVSRTVQFDSSGEGTITGIGPTLSYESWNIKRLTTQSDSTKQCYLFVYLRAIRPENFIGGTYSANNDTNQIELHLVAGEYLTFHYTQATPNAHGTIVIAGTHDIHAKVYG